MRKGILILLLIVFTFGSLLSAAERPGKISNFGLRVQFNPDNFGIPRLVYSINDALDLELQWRFTRYDSETATGIQSTDLRILSRPGVRLELFTVDNLRIWGRFYSDFRYLERTLENGTDQTSSGYAVGYGSELGLDVMMTSHISIGGSFDVIGYAYTNDDYESTGNSLNEAAQNGLRLGGRFLGEISFHF